MKTQQQKDEAAREIESQIDALQVWFASKPYGWRETASPQQLQQWADREREQEYLAERLAVIEGR